MRLVLFSFLLLVSHPLFAAETGLSVMTKVDAQSKNHKTQRSNVFMQIKQGTNHRDRFFKNVKKHDGDITKNLIKFYRPSKITGTALLTHSAKGKADNTQWIYLPAFKRTSQLSSKKKNDSFMGSDFSYADVAGRDVEKDNHELLKEDSQYYFIQSIPKDLENDNYSKLNLIIDKKTLTPIRISFYNKDGEKLKTLTNKSIKKYASTYLVTEAEMVNHLRDSKTLLKISDIMLDTKVTDNEVGLKGLTK